MAEKDDVWRRTRVRRGPVATAIPTSVDDVLLLNCRDHLAERGKDFGIVTMPVRLDGELQLVTRSLEAALYREAVGLDLAADKEPGYGKEDDVEQNRHRLDEAAAAVAHAEQEADARDDVRDAQNQQRVCFKILGSSPGRVKCITTFVPA